MSVFAVVVQLFEKRTESGVFRTCRPLGLHVEVVDCVSSPAFPIRLWGGAPSSSRANMALSLCGDAGSTEKL